MIMKTKFYTRLTMAFASLFMFTLFASAQTTIEIPIIGSLDDVEEVQTALAIADFPERIVGYVDAASSDLELIYDKEPQLVGLLFRDVQIPVGATVTNAYVQFTVDSNKPGTTDLPISLNVSGAKEANPADLTDSAFTVSSHPMTTAKVAWSPPSTVAEGDAGPNEQTPDISSVLNEIIALPDWAAGNKYADNNYWRPCTD